MLFYWYLDNILIFLHFISNTNLLRGDIDTSKKYDLKILYNEIELYVNEAKLEIGLFDKFSNGFSVFFADEKIEWHELNKMIKLNFQNSMQSIYLKRFLLDKKLKSLEDICRLTKKMFKTSQKCDLQPNDHRNKLTEKYTDLFEFQSYRCDTIANSNIKAFYLGTLKYLVTHLMDNDSGIFDQKDLLEILIISSNNLTTIENAAINRILKFCLDKFLSVGGVVYIFVNKVPENFVQTIMNPNFTRIDISHFYSFKIHSTFTEDSQEKIVFESFKSQDISNKLYIIGLDQKKIYMKKRDMNFNCKKYDLLFFNSVSVIMNQEIGKYEKKIYKIFDEDHKMIYKVQFILWNIGYFIVDFEIHEKELKNKMCLQIKEFNNEFYFYKYKILFDTDLNIIYHRREECEIY
ncbi:hypothetical protein CWI36_1446p0010 [Hamiltosporidium magnivora]|uniref:Uncharacterized protein n=1 Tax=Hamiltosporidium magnivora TaxID=148818 RepID=A0A4Q9L233_9MICR|nr:hypothetical protein CWI36_1446p0010 [Hamiltosporidium magnivora]